MARPKSKIERIAVSTSINKELIEKLREISEESQIPLNRLIENALVPFIENMNKKILAEKNN